MKFQKRFQCLAVIVSVVKIDAKFSKPRGKVSILSPKNSKFLRLRGGETVEYEEDTVAFVSKDSSKPPVRDTQKFDDEIIEDLRETFSDRSISLQKLLELQNFKPLAENFATEIKGRYGDTASKLNAVKELSVLRIRRAIRALKKADMPINRETIAKTLANTHNWMKTKSNGAIITIGSYNFDEGKKILVFTLALSLLGSSLGFFSFLYFVSVGFGTSVGIIAISILVASNMASKAIPKLSNVHTGLTLLWAIRLTSFLLHREYVAWPQWHEKLVEVNERADGQAKFSIWITCSVIYSMMMMPCINRMKEAVLGMKLTPWGLVGKCGILMQVSGLLLETVGDYQKGHFKAEEGNRNKWCNVGLYRYWPFPNYLGEVVFWIGTFLGGVACNKKLSDWIISTAGLMFILTVMKDNVESLNSKHLKRYGRDEDFMEARRKLCFLGPLPYSSRRRKNRIHI